MRARVMLDDFTAECLAVKVGIDLGGGDRLVAQHHLDTAQVGAALEQVCREGMAKGVGADGLRDTGQCGVLLDDLKDHDA